MRRTVESWTVDELYKARAGISFPEYQRQPHLWSVDRKQLLIDSILQDIDIPKLYFNRITSEEYEVIDGQQRLWAIWGFLNGDFSCEVNGEALRFGQLSPQTRKHFTSYQLQITIIEDANEKYLRDLFLRLQLGLLLITGEKLNAATGRMKEFIFKVLTEHPFIQGIGIQDRRFAKETLSAQICINSFSRKKSGQFARTRYEDLLQFVQEYASPKGKDLELVGQKEAEIPRVMTDLLSGFGSRVKDLRNRLYVLSVYLLFEELTERGTLPPKEYKTYASFTHKLWKRLREEAGAGFERQNKDLYDFQSYLSSAPGERYQIEKRHRKLAEFFSYFVETGEIKGD